MNGTQLINIRNKASLNMMTASHYNEANMNAKITNWQWSGGPQAIS